MHLTATAWSRSDDVAALALAEAAVELTPTEPRALYDAGVIGWVVSSTSQGGTSGKGSPMDGWRTHLERFLSLSEKPGLVAARPIAVARLVLAGKLAGRPPLLIPPAPGASHETTAPAEVPPAPSPAKDTTDGQPR